MQSILTNYLALDVGPVGSTSRVSFTVSIPAEVGQIQQVVNLVKARIETFGYPQSVLSFDIPLVLTEALANAVVHGSGRDSSKKVDISVKASRSFFSCTITDEGPGFNPSSAPTLASSDDYPLTHGRGIYLIKNLMSKVTFNSAGNQIRMLLVLPFES